MSYDPDHIAQTVQRLAAAAGSQRKLAVLAGLDSKTVSNAIHRRHGLTIRNAYKLAEAGGISIQELLGERSDFSDVPDDLLLARLERLLRSARRAAELADGEAAPLRLPPPVNEQK